MNNFKHKLFLNLALILIFNVVFFYCDEARAQSIDIISEKIISYQSYIEVQPDASMVVTETIKAIALGDKIKHGIYRDFPTKYKDVYGNRYVVDFKVLNILKDGVRENYWTEGLSNGVRVYIGDKNVLIPLGEQHTYEITYKTNRQLGFFKDHDELYWNVTGTGWEFPIDDVSATVVLPGDASSKIIATEAYTGPQGSFGKDFEVGRDYYGNAIFYTTKPLGPNENLSIVLSWPKGYVKEPDLYTRIQYFLMDNLGILIGAIGLIAILFYYLTAWNRYGRDPKKGTIIAQYEPPEGLSPAATRFILKMGFDNKVFTAAIINMAVKGYLKIKEEKKLFSKSYTLIKTNFGEEKLTKDEADTGKKLFDTYTEIEVKNENHLIIGHAISAIRKSLKKDFKKKYFITNLSYLGKGILLSLAVSFAIILTNASVATYFLLFPLFVLTNVVFFFLLRSPTVEGRKVMDKIEGFKLFLSVTEKDRLNFFNPPEKTPELFEKFLPYALALGVENQWAEQFSEIFKQIAERTGREYSPSWYYGQSWAVFNAGSFASDLGNSFSGAIASSSVPPGSSSGFGGGGGSGGGGGGGGGGGW